MDCEEAAKNEKKDKNNLKKSFYGSSAKETKIVGYCRLHHLNLTAKQIKTRKCLKRNCKALDRHEHEWWKRDTMPKALKHRNDLVKRNMESKRNETTKNDKG